MERRVPQNSPVNFERRFPVKIVESHDEEENPRYYQERRATPRRSADKYENRRSDVRKSDRFTDNDRMTLDQIKATLAKENSQELKSKDKKLMKNRSTVSVSKNKSVSVTVTNIDSAILPDVSRTHPSIPTIISKKWEQMQKSKAENEKNQQSKPLVQKKSTGSFLGISFSKHKNKDTVFKCDIEPINIEESSCRPKQNLFLKHLKPNPPRLGGGFWCRKSDKASENKINGEDENVTEQVIQIKNTSYSSTSIKSFLKMNTQKLNQSIRTLSSLPSIVNDPNEINKNEDEQVIEKVNSKILKRDSSKSIFRLPQITQKEKQRKFAEKQLKLSQAKTDKLLATLENVNKKIARLNDESSKLVKISTPASNISESLPRTPSIRKNKYKPKYKSVVGYTGKIDTEKYNHSTIEIDRCQSEITDEYSCQQVSNIHYPSEITINKNSYRQMTLSARDQSEITDSNIMKQTTTENKNCDSKVSNINIWKSSRILSANSICSDISLPTDHDYRENYNWKTGPPSIQEKTDRLREIGKEALSETLSSSYLNGLQNYSWNRTRDNDNERHSPNRNDILNNKHSKTENTTKKMQNKSQKMLSNDCYTEYEENNKKKVYYDNKKSVKDKKFHEIDVQTEQTPSKYPNQKIRSDLYLDLNNSTKYYEKSESETESVFSGCSSRYSEVPNSRGKYVARSEMITQEIQTVPAGKYEKPLKYLKQKEETADFIQNSSHLQRDLKDQYCDIYKRIMKSDFLIKDLNLIPDKIEKDDDQDSTYSNEDQLFENNDLVNDYFISDSRQIDFSASKSLAEMNENFEDYSDDDTTVTVSVKITPKSPRTKKVQLNSMETYITDLNLLKLQNNFGRDHFKSETAVSRRNTEDIGDHYENPFSSSSVFDERKSVESEIKPQFIEAQIKRFKHKLPVITRRLQDFESKHEKFEVNFNEQKNKIKNMSLFDNDKEWELEKSRVTEFGDNKTCNSKGSLVNKKFSKNKLTTDAEFDAEVEKLKRELRELTSIN